MDEALLAADVGRLKQLRQSLKNKIDVLSKLDELLLSVGEEELDYEIEQADVVRERAELAIIGLDEALTKISKRSEKRSPLRRKSPSSSSSEGEEHPGISPPSLATNGDEPDMLLRANHTGPLRSHCPSLPGDLALVPLQFSGSSYSRTEGLASPSPDLRRIIDICPC